ncbi:MAG: hypothetical protein ACLPWS_07710 [Rhodomicrobium sp.]
MREVEFTPEEKVERANKLLAWIGVITVAAAVGYVGSNPDFGTFWQAIVRLFN